MKRRGFLKFFPLVAAVPAAAAVIPNTWKSQLGIEEQKQLLEDVVQNQPQDGTEVSVVEQVIDMMNAWSVLLHFVERDPSIVDMTFVEGGRWLTYEAAWLGAPDAGAAVAAAHTLAAAGRVFVETHQLSGAIGFTHEHDLHVWSMRLQALRLEMDGVAAQRRAVVETRWGAR